MNVAESLQCTLNMFPLSIPLRKKTKTVYKKVDLGIDPAYAASSQSRTGRYDSKIVL